MNAKDFKKIFNVIKQVSKQKGFTEGLKGGVIGGLAAGIGYDVVKSLIKNAQQAAVVQKNPTLTALAGNASNIFNQLSINQKKMLVESLQKEISKAEAIEVPYEVVNEVKTDAR